MEMVVETEDAITGRDYAESKKRRWRVGFFSGFDEEEAGWMWVLGFGVENGVVDEVFGYEIRSSDESKPSFGDTPESK